jgi:hypothetical protein
MDQLEIKGIEADMDQKETLVPKEAKDKMVHKEIKAIKVQFKS